MFIDYTGKINDDNMILLLTIGQWRDKQDRCFKERNLTLFHFVFGNSVMLEGKGYHLKYCISSIDCLEK